ncbi:Phosphoribosylformylglycinamidine synthase subunit PurL [Varanus komodoensis]|nr:Phosphoribosylformylglycinamidine synthase subunit PurL [Varanus komodoensis]
MERQPVEVVVITAGRGLCRKRPAPALGEDLPVFKRPRRNSPDYPMEWEVSLPLDQSQCSSSEVFIPSSLDCPIARPQCTRRCKKPLRRAAYNPYDFTSDDLDPAYEWPRESSSAKKCGVDVLPLLRSTLAPFPSGLRLQKLEAMMWKDHKVQLWELSLQRGYGDCLGFLKALPGIRLKLPGKGASRCLVQLDPGECHASILATSRVEG